MTATATHPTCPHPLTEANCASGSFREIGGVRTFIPMASVCENCKINACDDCAESWPGTCACCGGGICGPCAATARSRRVSSGTVTRTEFLCAACATKQDSALSELLQVMHSYAGCTIEESVGVIWLADVIDELNDSVSTAKEAL